jgi:hypothetical protein
MNPAKLMRLFLRVTVLLMQLYVTRPEEIVSAVVMLLTVLSVDQLMSAKFEQVDGDFDAHTIAFAALMSRPLGLARSMWAPSPEGSGFVSLAMGASWCVAGLMLIHAGKVPRDREKGIWLPSIITAECGLGVMLTHAPFEPMWMYASRVFSFTCLSVLLYLDPPLERNCYLGERGYLVCFCPVLFVDWWMACLFVMAGVACIYMDDLIGLAARWHPHQPQQAAQTQSQGLAVII